MRSIVRWRIGRDKVFFDIWMRAVAAVGEVEGLAATMVRSLMREGGASIVVRFMVGFLAGVLTWCGIKILGLQSIEVLEFWWGYHTNLSIIARLPKLALRPYHVRK